MANKFWARKDKKYSVISSAPSVNKTQVGNAVVPVPYPVSEKLNKAKKTADDVLVNGKPAYLDGSNSASVKGDGQGKLGGIKSGTVEAKSEPIASVASPSVKSHNQRIVREGDLQMMQGGNTIGKITCSESASPATITDDGEIEGETLPPDLNSESAGELHKNSGQSSPRQSMPKTTKPTASNGSGGLGCPTGSPVILYTGQLYYTHNYEGIELAGTLSIPLVLSYISDSFYEGFFGRNRRFSYEKQFIATDHNCYRLYLTNGRQFDFIDTGQEIIDAGNLGVEVHRDGENWILEYFDQTTEIYSYGRLIKILDGNHNSLNFTYDASGALICINNSSGASLYFEYNDQQCVNRMYDQSGRQWRYLYNANYDLVEITPPQGRSETYSYQPSTINSEWSCLVSVKHSTGSSVLDVNYAGDGRVIAYLESHANYRYIYHQHQLVEKVDQHHHSTLYGLDQHGLISAITAADGSTQRETYDAATRTATIVINDSDPRIEKYDARHRLLSVTNGCCASCGQEVICRYEGKNPNPIRINDDGSKINNTYDERYNLLTTTAADGSVTSYAYDERGNISRYTDAASNTRQFIYNTNDQLISVIDPRGSTYTLDYDILSRKISQSDPDGNIEYFRYDHLDNVIEHQDALKHLTQFSFNDDNNLQVVTDPAHNTTHYRYEKDGQLTGTEKGGCDNKRYHLNNKGQLDAIKREDGSVVFFEYNDQQQIIQIVARQKIANEDGDEPQYIEEKLRCCYDTDGDLISAEINNHDVNFNYDGQGRLISSTQQGIEVNRRYTPKGNLHAGTEFMGSSFTYRYNENHQIEKIQRDFDCITQKYDLSGDITERLYPNQVLDSIKYDESGNITRLLTTDTRRQVDLKELNYQIDKRGFISEKYDSDKPEAIHYRYDAGGRLCRVNDEEFEYDRAGNLLQKKTKNNKNYRAIYNTVSNQLLRDQDHEYSYDERGNLIRKKSQNSSIATYYKYNLFDQLVEVSTVSDQQKLIRHLKFSYDALNRRICKSVTKPDTSTPGEVTRTTLHYLYDQNNIIAILDDDKKLLASILHGGEIDEPLSITTYNHAPLPLSKIEKSYFSTLSTLDKQAILEAKSQRTYYYHRDHQGSITALTNSEGKVVESFAYDDSYGVIINHTKCEETYNPYCYTAREFDAKDLYYYRARYYDPYTQRFISQDPLGFISGDTNLYRYVENNPVNFVDPAGYSACDALRKKKNKLYKKAIKPLAKTVAKQTAKLGAAAIPFIGWGMAAWTAYDLVNLGLELKELYKQFDALEAALQKCLAKSKKVNTSKTKEKNKSKGKSKLKCGDKKKYKSQGSGGHKGKNKDSDKLDKDHLPSKAHVNNSIQDTLDSAGDGVDKCIKNQISKNMQTLAIPHDVHKAKTSITSPHTKAGQSMAKGKSLSEIAKAETKVVRKEVEKKMDKNDPCRKSILENLKEFENLSEEYFDKIISDAISHCL